MSRMKDKRETLRHYHNFLREATADYAAAVAPQEEVLNGPDLVMEHGGTTYVAHIEGDPLVPVCTYSSGWPAGVHNPGEPMPTCTKHPDTHLVCGPFMHTCLKCHPDNARTCAKCRVPIWRCCC